MNFVTYPAILCYDIPYEVGIIFPDFPGCTGQCRSDVDILSYAQETLSFHLTDYDEELPAPSRIQDIALEDDEAVMPVSVCLPFFRENFYDKAAAGSLSLA